MSISDLHMYVYTLAYTLTCMSRKIYTHKTFHKHEVFLKVNDFLVRACVRSHDISLHNVQIYPASKASPIQSTPDSTIRIPNSTLMWLNTVFFKHNVVLCGQTR